MAAAFTDVHIHNKTDHSASKTHDDNDIQDWYGDGKRTNVVGSKGEGHFKHNADQDSEGGSVGGNAYNYNKGEFKWIFAWSTTDDGKNNKVYTDIQKMPYVVDWDQVKNDLDDATNNAKITKNGYTSTVTIQEGTTPKLTATILKKH